MDTDCYTCGAEDATEQGHNESIFGEHVICEKCDLIIVLCNHDYEQLRSIADYLDGVI